MNISSSAQVFREFAKQRGCVLEHTTPATGFEVMFAFYREVQAAEHLLDDRLLYQWNVWNSKEGPFFVLNLTRQFVEEGEEGRDDELMSQLLFDLVFPVFEGARAFKGSNEWLESKDDMDRFVSFVHSSPPYKAVKDLYPLRIELSWSEV